MCRCDQVFRALIIDGPPHHFVERFSNNNTVTVGQGHKRIGARLDIPNQFGIDEKLGTVQSRQLDHRLLLGLVIEAHLRPRVDLDQPVQTPSRGIPCLQ